MNISLLNRIPKKYRAAVKDIYRDEDGYWCTLNPGYHLVDYYGERTIHEDTYREFMKVFKLIRKNSGERL